MNFDGSIYDYNSGVGFVIRKFNCKSVATSSSHPFDTTFFEVELRIDWVGNLYARLTALSLRRTQP